MADSEFYEEVKETVWYLRVNYNAKDDGGGPNAVCRNGTGFTLRSDGLIMSVAHIIPMDSTYEVIARKMTETSFRRNVEVIYCNRAYDIAVLKIGGGEIFECGRLARDGSVHVGDELFHVGHPDCLVWTFSQGKASYPCMEDDVHLPLGDFSCDSYSNPYENTCPYRRAGDIWNQHSASSDSDSVSNLSSSSSSDSVITYLNELHAHLPLVQFTCPNAGGSSGGPVYNAKKEIIGMLALDHVIGQAFAVHVSLMRSVFSDVANANPRVEWQASSSKGASESSGH